MKVILQRRFLSLSQLFYVIDHIHYTFCKEGDDLSVIVLTDKLSLPSSTSLLPIILMPFDEIPELEAEELYHIWTTNDRVDEWLSLATSQNATVTFLSLDVLLPAMSPLSFKGIVQNQKKSAKLTFSLLCGHGQVEDLFPIRMENELKLQPKTYHTLILQSKRSGFIKKTVFSTRKDQLKLLCIPCDDFDLWRLIEEDENGDEVNKSVQHGSIRK